MMEYKKVMIDGVEYNCLTDEELEDLKVMIAYEERKRNQSFKTADFDEFIYQKNEKINSKTKK